MPGAPTAESRELSIGLSRVNLHLFSVSVEGGAYAVGFADLPGGAGGAGRERLLEDAQAAFTHNLGGAPSAEGRNALDGFPCREFRAPGTSNRRAVVLAARLCATDRRFYQLVYVGPADKAEEADIPLFLGSLKLVQ
jgi:hypothetical protein